MVKSGGGDKWDSGWWWLLWVNGDGVDGWVMTSGSDGWWWRVVMGGNDVC